MKNILATACGVLLLAACAAQPPAPSAPAFDIVILAPQGVDPALDTVGFNERASSVTQAFSDGISPVLRDKGYSVANVLDQSPAFDVGQKLAIHSVKYRAPVALVLTLESETVEQDSRLYLQVQHIQQELLVKGGNINGVRPSSVATQRYLLRSSVSGDSPGTMTDLVNNFVDFVQQEGRLK